jgi:hypothetical protein
MCPVIEFRFANRHHDRVAGEIINANISVVANIDVKNVDTSQAHAADRDSSIRGSVGKLFGSNRSLTTGRTEFSIDENATETTIHKHSYVPLEIEASMHPFFKRVWVARHVLNERSPLLRASVRRQIEKNGGKWPLLLNTHWAVRESLSFNKITVSFNGVANVSCNSVYAQKVYDYEDLCIGYTFVDIVNFDNDGNIDVNLEGINDVVEQDGGSGEPFLVRT